MFVYICLNAPSSPLGLARRQASSPQRQPQEALGPSVPARSVTSSARPPSRRLGAPRPTRCRAQARGETLLGSLGLVDCPAGTPSPPNSLQTQEMSQPQADGGRTFVCGEGLALLRGVIGVICLHFIPLWEPHEASLARSESRRPGGMMVTAGECFFHVCQCCDARCEG